MVTLQLGYVVQRKTFQERCHENLEVSWEAHLPVHYCLFVTHAELKEFLVQSIQGLDIVVVFIQYGEDIIQGNVSPWAPHLLPWVALQGTYDVGERVWFQHPVQWYTVKSLCQLQYVMASLLSSSLKTGRLIFIWPPGSLWGHWPWHGCLEPPRPSDIDATDEEVDAELLSLSNPWSDESKGDWGGAAHNSHCLWPWSWPHCGAQPCSWWTGWGPSLGTSHYSADARKFAGHGDESWLQKLNGVETCGMERGCLGLLGSICPSVMALAINCQPSSRLTALALSWACLPTQQMVSDSVNAASHTLPKVSLSPNDCHP